jgi:hypothetical protein
MHVKARKTRETATAVHAAYYDLVWVTRFSSRSYFELDFCDMLISRSTIFSATIYMCDYGTMELAHAYSSRHEGTIQKQNSS